MAILLKNVRLSFPDLWEAKEFDGDGKPKFRATFLMPKDHPQVKEIRTAIIQAAKDKFKDKWQQVLKAAEAVDKTPLHDGDNKAYDGYADMFYVSANSATRPTVIDADKTPLVEADGKPYSGCYVNASIEIYGYDNKSKGISAGLKGVQFFHDSDAFSGSAPASPDDFEDVSSGADAEELV